VLTNSETPATEPISAGCRMKGPLASAARHSVAAIRRVSQASCCARNQHLHELVAVTNLQLPEIFELSEQISCTMSDVAVGVQPRNKPPQSFDTFFTLRDVPAGLHQVVKEHCLDHGAILRPAGRSTQVIKEASVTRWYIAGQARGGEMSILYEVKAVSV
jgi:hypothetical protein